MSSSSLGLIPAVLRHLLKLPTLLLIYLAQTVGFALLYQAEHKWDHSAFLFNTAIIEKQSILDQRDLDRALASARMQLHALSSALTFPSLIRLEPKPPARRIPRKDRVVLRFERDNIEMYISFSLGGLKEDGELWITDTKRPDWAGFHAGRRFNAPEKFYEGNGFETSSEASAEVAQEFVFLIEEEVARLQRRTTDLENQIAALKANGPQWQFTEYLYFSVIVLGGGPGDIIPNSRKVRCVVIVQYIISVIIVCFLINGLAWSQRVSRQNILA